MRTGGRRSLSTPPRPLFRLASVSKLFTWVSILQLVGHPTQWKPVGKDLWQEVDGESHLFVLRDRRGDAVRLACDRPYLQYQRVPLVSGRHSSTDRAGGVSGHTGAPSSLPLPDVRSSAFCRSSGQERPVT
ncbi:MAG: hypothetical protein WDO73_29360 [Ignavibacteriota bacterium]